MRTNTMLGTLLDESNDDRLRVLIAGAGVAGLTLAAELRRQGLHPVVIEKQDEEADAGYMLGLMPLVAPAISELGLDQSYRVHSVGVRHYRLRDHHGNVIRNDDFSSLMDDFGDYRGISRGDLLDVLTEGGTPVAFDTTIAAIAQHADGARVTFAHGDETTDARFDLVVAADGLHSNTRDLVLPKDEYAPFDTGWGGWVSWIDPDPATTDVYEEVWGGRVLYRCLSGTRPGRRLRRRRSCKHPNWRNRFRAGRARPPCQCRRPD